MVSFLRIHPHPILQDSLLEEEQGPQRQRNGVSGSRWRLADKAELQDLLENNKGKNEELFWGRGQCRGVVRGGAMAGAGPAQDNNTHDR